MLLYLVLIKPIQPERFTALYLNAAARKRAEKESKSPEELEAAKEKEDSTEGKDWGIMPTLQMNLGLLSKSIGILGGLRLENDNNQVTPATGSVTITNAQSHFLSPKGKHHSVDSKEPRDQYLLHGGTQLRPEGQRLDGRVGL